MSTLPLLRCLRQSCSKTPQFQNLHRSKPLSSRFLSTLKREKKGLDAQKEPSARLIPATVLQQKPYPGSKFKSHIKSNTSSTTYQAYSQTLAQKLQKTLLYTAPSSLAYQISSYTAATFCIGYGVLSYWNNYLYAPPDIAPWVPYVFGGVSFAMILFGIRFLRNPLRMIQRMIAIPTKVNGKQTLEIEIELKKMFPVPFFPARVIKVAPHEIVIPTQLSRPVAAPLSQSEAARLRVQEMLRKEQELIYEKSHIMSAGLRHMGRAFNKGSSSLFRAVQRSFTRENLFEVRVRGNIYKLDLDGGWLLDQGLAINRLATLEPHSNIDFLSRITR
ncbi:hypothetical protein K3495_g1738 [Podosphaera aphanis]|nr:hypothetical protein K3495_g1738 [Podosphaera aphanis]